MKEKVKNFMNDPKVNPLILANNKITSLVEEIEAKKAEVVKLQKAVNIFNCSYKIHFNVILYYLILLLFVLSPLLITGFLRARKKSEKLENIRKFKNLVN